MMLCDRFVSQPGRSKPLLESFIADCILALAPELYHRFKIFFKYRFSIRCKCHYLIFIRGVQETKIAGYSFVEKAKGVRHVYLPYPEQLIILTDIIGRSRYFTSSI